MKRNLPIYHPSRLNRTRHKGGGLIYIVLLVALIILVVVYYSFQPAEREPRPKPEPTRSKPPDVAVKPPAPKDIEEPPLPEVKTEPQPITSSDAADYKKFEEMMTKRGCVKMGKKWVQASEVPHIKQELIKKDVASKGLVEHNGDWIKPREKEILTFQEKMRKKGYYWKYDRWVPIGEEHPWDDLIQRGGWSKKKTEPDTEVSESPEATLPEPEKEPELPLTPRICEGETELELTDIKPLHRTQGTTVLIKGKTNLPTDTILFAELKNGVSQTGSIARGFVRVTASKSFKANLDIIQGTLPKGFYQGLVFFDKVIQGSTLETKLKDVPDKLKVGKLFNVGTLDEIRELVEQDKIELTNYLKELSQFRQELEEHYQQALQDNDENGYKQWAKGWSRRFNQSFKQMDEHSVALSRFPDTLSNLKSLKGSLIALDRKYQLLVSGKKEEELPHSLEKKYASLETFSDIVAGVQDSFSTESEQWEILLEPEEEDEE